MLSNLREFPALAPEARTIVRLQEISKELLEVAEVERAMRRRIESLSSALAQLQNARDAAVVEQAMLLARLARDTQIAS